MAKKVIKLTGNELNRLIIESVKNILSEVDNTDDAKNDDIDITKIDIETLRNAYRDLRLTPTSSAYGDVLSEPQQIREAFGDILEPDDAIKRLLQKYGLPQQFARKVEHYHKIYIYVIIAKVGENDKIIENDMMKMGYFLSFKKPPVSVNGMVFQQLQFEPTSQLQDDVTEEIKSKYDYLYHWTPIYNINGIRENGLIPSHKNEKFDYPPRTYLMAGDSDENQMKGLGQSICFANNNPSNNGMYALLSIDIENIDDRIRFYYDPNSAIGIYTEQTIPSDRARIIQRIQFVKSLKRP